MTEKLSSIDFFIKRYFKYPLFRLFCLAGRILCPITERDIPKNKKISRILVIQIGGIGDVIRLFPCLLLLRREFPDASITTLTQYGDKILRLLPDSSEIISENIILEPSKRDKTMMSKLHLALRLRKSSFDLVFSPNYGLGMIEFSIISFLTGAPYRIGYNYRGSGFLYSSKMDIKEDTPLLLQHLELLSKTGVRNNSIDGKIWFKVPEEDLSFAQSFLQHHNVSKNDLLLAIAPITIADRDYKSPMHHRSLFDYRAWPEDRYMKLINEIFRLYKVKIIVLGDSLSSGRLSDYLIHSKNPNVINAVGKTNIGQAAALIETSNLFISNDSGLLHVAIALQKPSIGIFGSTSPRQVIHPVDYCIPIWKELECSPCFIHQPIPDFNCASDIRCLRLITVEEVLEAIKSLLRS